MYNENHAPTCRPQFTYTLLDDLENREAGWVPSEIVLLHKLGLTTAGGGGNN